LELTLDTIRDIRIYQSKKGYRFSVDALILYSFVNLRRAEKIADLGAGSGIIGILLAKKYPESHITLVEVQGRLARLAEKNCSLNHLEERVAIVSHDIRTINSAQLKNNAYDLVVSNPPFRRQKTGLISQIDEKAIARHEIKLRLPDLISSAFYLLRDKGRFCMIYHPSRLVELIEALRNKQMEPKRLRFVHSNINTEAKMVLVEAVKNGRTEMKIENPLYIYDENGFYKEEMKNLIKD